jgi:hypothetical protein
MFAPGVALTTLPTVVAQAVSAVALVLLAASGVSKVLDPDPTRGAMAAARLPSSRWIARGLGVVEVFAAVIGLSIGGSWLALAAALYVGFFLFTLSAMTRRLPIQSCGCFGKADTPPTWLHVVYNGLSTLALGVLVAMNETALPWAASSVEFGLYVAFSLLGAYLAYLVLSQLPRTFRMTISE